LKKKILFVFLLLIGNQIFAQINVRDSAANGYLISAHLGGHLPGGDLQSRFGLSADVGAGLWYKFRSHWIIGADGSFVFGNIVTEREQLLRGIATQRGEIIGAPGDIAIVNLFQRGIQAHAKVGKVFTKWGHNANSGPLFLAGAGFTQSWIRIDNPGKDVPAVAGEYRKGYDQLHNGFSLYQMLGYTYLSSRQRVNFTIGLEFIQGFTYNRRGYNFHTRSFDLGQKIDLYTGLRFMWHIPIYDKNAQTFYYF
jgi:hypothetical protein